jgi:hypothetical protein
MTERQFKRLEVEIARYQFLRQEVTDPLAAGLLHSIVSEIEADLKKIQHTEDARVLRQSHTQT